MGNAFFALNIKEILRGRRIILRIFLLFYKLLVEGGQMKRTLILFIFIIFYNVYSMDVLKLEMAEYPPYAYEENGEFSGFGVEKVIRILNETEINYVISSVPNFGRAFKNMVDTKNDGFFLASQNRYRDKYGVFSKKIETSEWTWVKKISNESYLDNILDEKKITVGVQLNSNLEIWLKSRGYNVIATPSDVESLVNFLDMERVDVIFLPKKIFLNVLDKKGKSPKGYMTKIEKTEDLGLYISKKYINSNPKVMDKINEAIDKCNADE